MSKVLGILFGMIALGVIPYALSIEAPNPPPGILAGNWIPMGDAAGFVITDTGNESRAVRGYFMARHGKTWFRVDSTGDYEAHPSMCPTENASPLYGI